MISYLKGEVMDVKEASVTIITAGVGYEVNMAAPSLASLEEGSQAALYISESLSPYDGTALYGFLSKQDKALFLLFKENIPNTGPKKALEFLAKALRSPADFHRAIINKDAKILTGIFGFTSKTAQKIIDSLKEKMDAFTVQGEVKIKMADFAASGEVYAALSALGYSANEVRKAMEILSKEGVLGKTAEENITAALRILGK